MKATDSTLANKPSGNCGQPWLIALASLALGAALAAAWFHFHSTARVVRPDTAEISPATRNVLANLSQPVTIRYYSLLPAGSADEDLPAFAGRVDQLLAAMQEAGGGNVPLRRNPV